MCGSGPEILGDGIHETFVKHCQNVIWKINYSGEPDPVAVWYKHEIPIVEDERFVI